MMGGKWDQSLSTLLFFLGIYKNTRYLCWGNLTVNLLFNQLKWAIFILLATNNIILYTILLWLLKQCSTKSSLTFKSRSILTCTANS